MGAPRLSANSTRLVAGTCVIVMLLVGSVGDVAHGEATDPAVEVLTKLGVKNAERSFNDLHGRIGRTDGVAPGEADALVSDLRVAISQLPTEILDAAYAKGAVTAAFKATSRADLIHWVDVFREVHNVKDELMPGTRVFLYVRGTKVTIGNSNTPVNLLSMGLDKVDLPPSEPPLYYLDMVYIRADGTIVNRAVLGSAGELQDEPTAKRVAQDRLAWELGGRNREFKLSFMREGGEDVLERPLNGIQRPPEEVIEDLDRLRPSGLSDSD